MTRIVGDVSFVTLPAVGTTSGGAVE
jgi:hypothetical protein